MKIRSKEMLCHFSDFKKTFDVEIDFKICVDRQLSDLSQVLGTSEDFKYFTVS